MLPVKVTDARIMVFEYESQWFGRGSINQRLSSVADQIVQALYRQRSRGAKRPIVFVCHCLGGIVVEKAMVTAKLRQTDWASFGGTSHLRLDCPGARLFGLTNTPTLHEIRSLSIDDGFIVFKKGLLKKDILWARESLTSSQRSIILTLLLIHLDKSRGNGE